MTRTINLRDLPDEVVRKAKAYAALHGMTLRDFVLQAIGTALAQDLPLAASAPMAATTHPVKKHRPPKR